MTFVQIQGRRIEYELACGDANAPVIVFLHEGLGSLAMWKDFPGRIAAATGCGTLVYSRYGHGASERLAALRRPDFMHEEALKALPELLDKLAIERPLLLGHSDGGSIALIHAAAAGRPVVGLIVEAPHVMVEEISIDSIREAKKIFESTDLRGRLARYHADAEATFRGWNDIWLDPGFRDWSIEGYLPRIACPVLAIQGEDDEYGTMRQIERIAESATDVQLLKLGGCGHAPHRDRPDAVVEAAAGFIRKCRGGTRAVPAKK
ncbi:MAG TPA: alpha/beta hydrolase [Burkholderiales bacterium]|nr:alpha/beta hydrolase [Burkholderiales bacterium]